MVDGTLINEGGNQKEGEFFTQGTFPLHALRGRVRCQACSTSGSREKEVNFVCGDPKMSLYYYLPYNH